MNGFRKKLMIPEFEIPQCPEHEVKSKIGNIFVKEYSVKIYKTDPYFYEYYRKKYKLMKMVVNLELKFILLSIFQPQKLMKKIILTEILFLRRKYKKHQKKVLFVNLLKLMRIKKAMMQTMKLVE